MKRFLIILVMLSWCSVGVAEEDCDDFIDLKWLWVGKNLEVSENVEASEAVGAKYIFKSTSKKSIRIHRINLKTAEKDVVVEEKFDLSINSLYIPPYGKTNAYLTNLRKLNLDVVKFAGYACTFEEKPITKKKKNKTKSKSNSSEKSGVKKLLEKIIGN